MIDRLKWHTILAQHLPQQAVDYVIDCFEKYPIHLKITRERQTKHGDFRYQTGKQPVITINHNLNRYAFLITLLHELAHYTTFKKFSRNVLPHGAEWKNEFRMLMLPVLNNQVFPDELLSVLAHHLKNPKASSNTDSKLFLTLKKFDDHTQNPLYLSTCEIGESFSFQNRIFVLEEKRRTRYLCLDVVSRKKYLIHQHAAVQKVDNR